MSEEGHGEGWCRILELRFLYASWLDFSLVRFLPCIFLFTL